MLPIPLPLPPTHNTTRAVKAKSAPQRHALLRDQHAVIGRDLARDVREQGEVQPAEAAGPVFGVGGVGLGGSIERDVVAYGH